MYLYILKCSDNSYYTGVANDLNRRVMEHQLGTVPTSYTANRLPVKLVYSQYFNDPNEAIKREKQIKRWNRVKKEALSNVDFEFLKNYKD